MTEYEIIARMKKIGEQIGWYNPASKRFCYLDEKDHYSKTHAGYIVPVYIPKKKKT